jgi:hypothetical protein
MTSPPTPFVFAAMCVITPLDVDKIAIPKPGTDDKSLTDL